VQALSDRLRGERRNPFGPDSLTRVITVTSGKGGVGKSTVTANLAVALARRGLSVGVLDADVHGFSIPGLLGIPPETSPVDLDGLIVPPVAHRVKAISIGMFLPPDDRDGAVAWRGPMLHRTLNQFLTDVHFGALDVLLVDTPPGTGDVAISLGQLLPHAEVLVVTTPQAAAADVAVRSGLVARKLGQRLIGVVETMAPARLPDGSLLDLFGAGGGEAVATRLSIPLLASVPLSAAVRLAGDAGRPLMATPGDDDAAVALEALAAAVAAIGRGLSGRRLPVGV
jgi:ATP-binding protein involved in chromosome partitioning